MLFKKTATRGSFSLHGSCFSVALKHWLPKVTRLGRFFAPPTIPLKKTPSSYRLRFGFTVLTSFNEAAKDGKMVMPQPNDKVRGGLALGCFGMPWDAMGPHHTSSTVGAALVWASLNTIDLENCHFHPQWTGAPDPTRILS